MSGAPNNTDSTEEKAGIHGDPPQLTVTLPSAEDGTAETRHRDDASLPVDVLLLAVKEYATDPSSHYDSNPTRPKQAKLESKVQAPQCTEAMIQTEHLTECASHSADIVEWIRQIYERREGQVLPVPWCKDFSFHLKDIFTGLRIVGREKTRGALTADEVINMTGIFKPHTSCQNPQIVLIEAESGMGKTTYCQKLAYDWATKQEHEWEKSFPKIEVLLLLRCRDIKSSIWEAIDEQILPEDVDEKAKQIFFQFVRENPSKVLLVLDGLDEVDPNELAMYFNLIERKQLPGSHIVLSSSHETGKKVRRYCDTLWEIVGLTRKRAKRFIRAFFLTKEHLSEKLIEKLWPRQRKDGSDDDDDDNDDGDDDDDDGGGGGGGGDGDGDGLLGDLRDLTRNPLHLTLLCSIFEDLNGVLPDKRTQLFKEIVNCVLARYEDKNGPEKDLIPVYEKELVLLGCKALQCLREGVFHFEENEDLSRCVLKKCGFLSIQTGGSKRLPCIRYGFHHKRFQEFFSGFYLAIQILHGHIDCESVVTDERYLAELNQVFVFLSGIIASKCEVTTVSLLSSIAAHVNFLSLTSHANVSKYLCFAFDYISECTKYNGEIYARLACTLGRTLSLTSLHLSQEPILPRLCPQLGTFCLALEVNSTLTNLDLRGNSIRAKGAISLSQALRGNSTLTNLHLGENSIGDEGALHLSWALRENSTLTNLDLSVNRIGARGARSLSQALRENSTLTNLDLRWNRIRPEGARFLSLALTENSTLTNLDLRGNRICPGGAASLSLALTNNSTLTNLDLDEDSIGGQGARVFFHVLGGNSTLTYLDLGENSIGDQGAIFFSHVLRVNSTLTYLDLGENRIGAEGALFLFQALTENSTLTNLDLVENRIGAEGACSLSQALIENSTLTNLHLGVNSIGAEGACSLSQALKRNLTLTNLDLRGNGIRPEGARFLSLALSVNSTLTNLGLFGNSIGPEGADSLSQALRGNSTLTNLDLGSNSIGAEGADSLSQALRENSTLTNLDLSVNRIGDEGAHSLSQALTKNSTLTNLVLRVNSIGDEGARSLSQALRENSTLTNLNLRWNSIRDDGADSLSQALRVNSTLTYLDLRWNSIGDEGAHSLSQALTENSTLTYLDLGENNIGAEVLIPFPRLSQ